MHFYAVPAPGSAVRAASDTAARALHGQRGLGIQPDEYVHVTIRRLDAFETELARTELERLRDAAERVFGDVPAFSLDFAAPRAMAHAIEASGEANDGWRTLQEAVDAVVEGARLEGNAVPPPERPHYTIAYCVEDMNDDAAIDAVLRATARPARFEVDHVALVSVAQDATRGMFSFDVLETWMLRNRLRLPDQPLPPQETVP